MRIRDTRSGIDARGYYSWSLLDSSKWASGYGLTFGSVAVDPQTLQRVSKSSSPGSAKSPTQITCSTPVLHRSVR
ncbi:family 1 glycosylhydrolase [Arthrobacter sp. MDT1-48-3]